MSMDRGLRDFWIQLMESGKYKFTKEWLCINDKRDPFGVLCSIAVSCGIVEEVVSSYGEDKIIKYDGNIASFSPKLQRWSGISHDQTQMLYMKTDKENSYQPAIEYIKENL